MFVTFQGCFQMSSLYWSHVGNSMTVGHRAVKHMSHGTHRETCNKESLTNLNIIWNITVNLNQYKYPTHAIWALMGMNHKVLTNVEYRAVPGVFQNIDPPPPSPPSECVLPPHQRRGVHTRRAVRGVGGQYFGRRERYGLASYSIISLLI